MLIRGLSMFACLCSLSSGQQVFVKADAQVGIGILRPYKSSCYVLTPLHVVQIKNDDGSVEWADSIEVTDRIGQQAEALPFQQRQPDLAVLKIKKSELSICSQVNWGETADIASILNSSSDGVLLGVGDSGSQVRFEISLENYDEDYITIAPRNSKRTIEKGLSGSLIQVEGQKLAMVISVDTPHNEATALRFDRIDALTADIFIETRPCQEQCQLSTSELKPAGEPMEGECPSSLTSAIIPCTRREVVFALPSDWPTYRYLHIVTTAIGDADPIVEANLSDSKKKNASEVMMIEPMMAVTSVRNVICKIKIDVHDVAADDFTIQVTGCNYFR